jgi:hypothetical protein
MAENLHLLDFLHIFCYKMVTQCPKNDFTVQQIENHESLMKDEKLYTQFSSIRSIFLATLI